MNSAISAIGLLFLFIVFTSAACEKKDKSKECPPETICTMMFAAVTTKIIDQNGSPVLLDEVYTIRKSTSELLKYDLNIGNGVYTVLDDSYQKELANKNDTFTLVGKKDGSILLEEPFIIAADCCHVKKVSGKTEIVLP